MVYVVWILISFSCAARELFIFHLIWHACGSKAEWQEIKLWLLLNICVIKVKLFLFSKSFPELLTTFLKLFFNNWYYLRCYHITLVKNKLRWQQMVIVFRSCKDERYGWSIIKEYKVNLELRKYVSALSSFAWKSWKKVKA